MVNVLTSDYSCPFLLNPQFVSATSRSYLYMYISSDYGFALYTITANRLALLSLHKADGRKKNWSTHVLVLYISEINSLIKLYVYFI